MTTAALTSAAVLFATRRIDCQAELTRLVQEPSFVFLSDTRYQRGDLLSGVVVLDLESPLEATDLVVCITGRAVCEFVLTTTHEAETVMETAVSTISSVKRRSFEVGVCVRSRCESRQSWLHDGRRPCATPGVSCGRRRWSQHRWFL